MARIRPGRLRHTVDIYRDPTGAYGTSGENQGQPQLIKANVPCSIDTLSGRQLEQARAQWDAAVLQVDMFADPAWNLDSRCYLKFGTRRLYVGFVNNIEQAGFEYQLLCGESPWETANGNS